MKNKHLEHIEDHVLTGKQGALDAIRFLDTKQSQVSVKYDGAPAIVYGCLLYTSPSPRDLSTSRMPSSA